MTVMVTGASGLVGRATVKALLARDEVRATVRRASDASYLRQLGAKVAVRDVDTPDALSEILPACHTVVHLIVVGAGDTELAPVFVEDVASVIAGIDDAQAELAGTWGLEGPDVVTADGFAGMLRGDSAEPTHASGQAAAEILTRLLGVPFDAV